MDDSHARFFFISLVELPPLNLEIKQRQKSSKSYTVAAVYQWQMFTNGAHILIWKICLSPENKKTS